MFHSILTTQARSFAAKAAKAAVPQVEAVIVKTKAVKLPKVSMAQPLVVEKVAAKPAKKATKASVVEIVVPAPKTSKAAKVAAVVKVVKEPVAPKIAKVKVPEVAKVVKIPTEFRPKIKSKVSDEPVSDQATIYAERREKFQDKLVETVAKMEKLVQKTNYSQPLLAKYKLRADKLQIKIDRAHSWFKKAQSKAKKTERLKNMPPRESLASLSQKERLNTILKIDTAIRSGYQLFARELNLIKGGNFSAYIDGWKKTGKAEQDMYTRLVASAKASREAASV